MRFLDSSTLLGLTLASSLALPALASAASTPCVRDSECAGAEACVDGACEVHALPLSSCGSVDDCDHNEACTDGYCKSDDIVCRNPAGACWLTQSSGECSCLDGDGGGWSDGFNPDDPAPVLTEEELQVECSTTLADMCGTETPSLSDACTDTVLQECQAYADKVDVLAELCDATVPFSNLGLVNSCCEEYDVPEFVETRECLLAADVNSCESAYTSCYGTPGDPAGEGSTDDDASTDGLSGSDDQDPRSVDDNDDAAAEGSDADGSKGSCAVDRRSANGGWLLALGALLWFGRRRRRAL